MTLLRGKPLSEGFYNEVVSPLLSKHFPRLSCAAGLFGPGSEILGFDDEMSQDHHWGCRLQLFLPKNCEQQPEDIHDFLRQTLPFQYKGFHTNFSSPDESGVRLPVACKSHPIEHMVSIFTEDEFFKNYLGYQDIERLTEQEWLSFSEHKLCGVRCGQIFSDPFGLLQKVQTRLEFYPELIWKYLLACQWSSIAEEEAFTGRTGFVGDDIGSALVASRQVKRMMHLSFLMEKQFAPYAKWFGTGFQKLTLSKLLTPHLTQVLQARTWKEREKGLCEAYLVLAKAHNDLEITEPIHTSIQRYHGRPFQVLFAHQFSTAIFSTLPHSMMLSLPQALGSINQALESDDLASETTISSRWQRLYRNPSRKVVD